MNAKQMGMLSVALGLVSVAMSLLPLIPLQLVGAAVGAGGVWCSRRSKKMDYRADMFSTIGIVSSVIGILLCLFVPTLFIIANVVKLIA